MMCVNLMANINENSKTEKVRIAYFTADQDLIGRQFDQYLQAGDIRDNFDLQRVNSIEEGQKLVEDEKVQNFIYLEKDLSPGRGQELKPSIRILGKENNALTKLLVANFVHEVNSFLL